MNLPPDIGIPNWKKDYHLVAQGSNLQINLVDIDLWTGMLRQNNTVRI